MNINCPGTHRWVSRARVSYLLQLGFHPVTVVGKLVQKLETAIYRRRNNTQNNTKTQNAQNRE
jgi:cobalamin biosynthesis protein CobD/CbiB